MKPDTKPKRPANLGLAGKRFWDSTTAEFDFREAHHLALLENCCRFLDRAATAREIIDKEGTTITNHRGEVKEHPACHTERQSMAAFRGQLKALELDKPQPPQVRPAVASRRIDR